MPHRDPLRFPPNPSVTPRKFIIRWSKRKTHYYNPNHECQKCGIYVADKHRTYCNLCLDLMTWQQIDSADYFETIESIHASFLPV